MTTFNRANFRKEELVNKQGNTYPVVGGRLRLAHEEAWLREDGRVEISTEEVLYVSETAATVKATVVLGHGTFQAHGTASFDRDGGRMKHSLLELAETRAVARALRYGGYGVEFTGAEEVSHDAGKKSLDVRPAGGTRIGQTEDAATPKQLSALRAMAKKVEALSGEPVSITPPKTKAEASKALDDLAAAIDAYEGANDA